MSEDISGRYLRDIEAAEKEAISQYPNIEKLEGFTLYWKPLHESAFRFYALEWVATDTEERYDIVASGVAYFDGIRHLNLGDEGYFCYPDLDELILLLQRIHEIESSICWDTEGFKEKAKK